LGGTNASGSVEDCYYLDGASISGVYPTSPNSYGTADDLIGTDLFTNWSSSVWTFSATEYPILTSSPASLFHFRTVNQNGSFSTASDWEYSSTIDGTYSESVVKPDYTNSLSITVLIDDTLTIANGKDAYVSTAVINRKLIVANGGTLHVEHESANDNDLIINGDLEIAGNFVIGQSATVVGNDGSKITLNGTTAQTIADGLTTVYNLTINNTAGVTLPDSMVVNGTLTVTSGSYTGPTTIEVDGYSSPSFKHLSWGATTHNIQNHSTSTTVSALFPTYINRSWTISGNIDDDTVANRKKTITFYWNASEDNSYVWGTSTPVLYEGGIKIAEASSSSLTGDTRNATFDYTFPKTFSASKEALTIGLEDGTLPVQLSTFDAFNHSGNNVMIRWITESESNLDGYRLYRNNENVLENAIMLDVFISGTNTSQSQTYSYIDDTITSNGIYYYWIQMIDYDGSNSFYGPAILQVDNDFNQEVDIPLITGLIAIYPNPFNPTTTISYGLEFNSPVVIDIYNIKGQIVKTFDIGLQAQGFHQINWHGRDNNEEPVASGIYFSRLKTQDKVDIKKIVLMK